MRQRSAALASLLLFTGHALAVEYTPEENAYFGAWDACYGPIRAHAKANPGKKTYWCPTSSDSKKMLEAIGRLGTKPIPDVKGHEHPYHSLPDFNRLYGKTIPDQGKIMEEGYYVSRNTRDATCYHEYLNIKKQVPNDLDNYFCAWKESPRQYETPPSGGYLPRQGVHRHRSSR